VRRFVGSPRRLLGREIQIFLKRVTNPLQVSLILSRKRGRRALHLVKMLIQSFHQTRAIRFSTLDFTNG